MGILLIGKMIQYKNHDLYCVSLRFNEQSTTITGTKQSLGVIINAFEEQATNVVLLTNES